MIATMIALNSINRRRESDRQAHREWEKNHRKAYSYEATERVEKIPEFAYDVMKSKYSKKVIKTYKTRKGAENFIKRNGLDTVIKVRIESYREVRF